MYDLSREELDGFAMRSQHKLAAAYEKGIYKDEIVPWLKELTDDCHEHGAAVMIQITHLGRRTSWNKGDWLPVLAPSRVREPAHRAFPKEAEDWDLDRIVSFYEAARAAGRELVVDTRQALLLENLGAVLGDGVPRLGDGIRVFARRQGWGIVGNPDFPEEIQEQDYGRWERPFAFSAHRILDNEIHEEQDGFLVYMDFFHLQALMDLRPSPGSLFIRSMVEPFNEEMELDEARIDNWMAMFGLEKHQVHASGHACGDDLRNLVDTISPRTVVPIHTERPGEFIAMHSDVRLPRLGVPMDL